MICKICNENFKNIPTHVRMKHNKTMEEYMSDDIKKEVENDFSEDEGVISPKEKQEKIFGNQDKDSNRPLQDLLTEFDITETELRSIVRQYKIGAPISTTQSLKAKTDIGTKDAKVLSESGKSEITTTNIYTSEKLVKGYGFEVINVRSGPPKTWVLTK